MADDVTTTGTITARLREELGFARGKLNELRQRSAVGRKTNSRGELAVPDAFASIYADRAREREARRHAGKAPLKRLPLWFALWNLAFVKEVRSERLGLFWWFAEPLMLILIFTIMTLVFFGGSVANMPSFPFAIMGVAQFLTFRTTFMTTALGAGHLVHCLNEPSVTRFDLMFGQAPRALVANAVVAGGLLAYLVWIGFIPLPEDPRMVLVSLFCSAALGFSLGLWASLMTFLYAGFRRLYPAIMRAFAITGGLFYVSEQLPVDYKPLVLWNPIIHAAQLTRDAWFTVYESADASLWYLVTVTVVSLSIGLGFAIMERRRRAEAGDIE